MLAGDCQLLVCETCGYDPQIAPAERRGERFARELEALAEAGTVERTRCLMACERGCNVLLRAPGKIAYVLGDFAPGDGSAQAVLDYRRLYLQSSDGKVALRDWPAGVRGHCIARIPPPA
ncbi:TPA: DUF1636 domain-containing protein [Klebsiella pneumoniae]